jgi:hypothetical protein
MSLIESLVSQFGLSTPQAQGAVGAVARLAQGKLGGEHMAELAKLIPGLDGMIAGAPKPGGMASMLGETAALGSVLNQLGIDLGKAKPIAMAILAFVQSNGSEGLKGALARLLPR